ncbi:DUF4148 domain-containing protein [Burkholderia stagnalis]|uniref:DUF4148 domain-containing protein n=1 Tax=Burkholderia stagnalis TaxID=1503054 RepID=UPI0007559020|nr:DUF4148 domain-containing protein [Burkholderia stagnalis]KVL94159.1 hypothetical protein WT03_17260 [Burkholderia stagnalis]KVM01396.1 hypothetical protein WT02_06800 [Burkholderia stagnalis]KVM02581.1 hypothetical protein WT04_33015 [Burkholderia stagnalis]KVN26594.1 hypothetical protein WT11_33430 [Burkholderia stagnalis]KVO58376.1 hypothetical protein WT18_14435 [Burkholderia stagnalis]
MKSLVVTAAAAAVLLASPALSFAQSSSHVTRAQVLQELYDLESVGYNPSTGDSGNYPDDIMAAQARLDAKRLAEHKAATAAYGPAGTPAVESGTAAKPAL